MLTPPQGMEDVATSMLVVEAAEMGVDLELLDGEMQDLVGEFQDLVDLAELPDDNYRDDPLGEFQDLVDLAELPDDNYRDDPLDDEVGPCDFDEVVGA
jgi:hypothetical protein